MRSLIALLIWLASVTSLLAEEVIHFVALAGIKPGHEAKYDAFIEAVTPIWKRHGMTVITRARPVGPFRRHAGIVDLAVLRVESRRGFYAYANDPDYKALQPQRLASLDFLSVFDGKVDMTNQAGLRNSKMLRVWFVSQPGSNWGKVLNEDLSQPTDAAISINLGVVGRVKGDLDDTLDKTRTIHVEAVDTTHPAQPPYLGGLYVVSGPRLN